MLPIVVLGSAAFHFLIGLSVWIVFYLIFFGLPPVTILLLPLILLPLVLMVLGFSWLLASLGVYLRDVGQIIVVVTTVLMFLSPIFYPIAALPEEYHPFILISPLTFVVEQARALMIWDKCMDWAGLALWMAISTAIAWMGFVWFQKTRKGFADVL